MSPLHYINTILINPKVPFTPEKQDNSKYILAQLERLVPPQTNDCHTNPDLKYSDPFPPQVTITHEGMETSITSPQLDLHTAINALYYHENTFTAMFTSISSTRVSPYTILEYKIIFSKYKSYLIPDLLHQLGVKC